MPDILDTINNAIIEAEKLNKLLKKSKKTQIKSRDEKLILRTVPLVWFKKHRPIISSIFDENEFIHIDKNYQYLLEFSDKIVSRNKCILFVSTIVTDLQRFRTSNIKTIYKPQNNFDDLAPDFSTIVSDSEMLKILASRWDECVKCIEGNAPLAAVVMMGGLLETLLLSKINSLPDLSIVFKCKSAPKNSQVQTLPLKEWTLRNYIEVAHDLKWITQTVKDLGVVLRDYRNFIHPFKQRTYNIVINQDDSILMWNLCKNIAKQIL